MTEGAIETRPPGYVLDLGTDATDLQTVTRLVEESRRSTDPARSVARLRAALELWRGRPLADVSDLAWLADQAERLLAFRLEIVQALVEARLGVGEHAELVTELTELSREHPYHEQVHGQLMRALYRTGLQADALAAYQRLRRRLAGELGIDPGPALRDLQAAILRQDPALDPPAPGVIETRTAADSAGGDHHPATRAGPAVPRQIPAEVPGFAGRAGELASMDELLAAAGRTNAVSVCALSGVAGIGKPNPRIWHRNDCAPCQPGRARMRRPAASGHLGPGGRAERRCTCHTQR